MTEKLTLNKFEEAAELVKKVTLPTKLEYSETLSNMTGGKIYLKPENLQYTGAYKVRGAFYKIATLNEEQRSHGLITASAGNHAQGVAYAAKKFGCKATIVMPTGTPLIKVNRTKGYGAEVILYGDVYDDAYEYAMKLADERHLTFIHPFDDLDVATGQGTIAMEIVQELPTVDYILVPVGGGGLVTGVSTLAKMLNPKIKVIVSNSPTPETLTALSENRIDLGVVSSPLPALNDFVAHKVREVQDIFVAAGRFWELKNKQLSYEMLEQLPVICLEKNTSTRQYMDTFLAQNRVFLAPEFELATSDMIVQFAIRNMGIGCVMEEFAKEKIESGELFELAFREMMPEREICVVTDRKVPISPAGERFLEVLRERRG